LRDKNLLLSQLFCFKANGHLMNYTPLSVEQWTFPRVLTLFAKRFYLSLGLVRWAVRGLCCGNLRR